MTAWAAITVDGVTTEEPIGVPSVAVLLVDDEPAVRRALGRVLRHAGFAVSVTGSAEEALDVLRRGARFDVIVTDLHLPGMQGPQFLQSVRALDADVPLIVVTGYPSIESAAATVAQGGYRYLIKPVHTEVLCEAIRSASASHRLAQLKGRALELCRSEGFVLDDQGSLVERFTAALDRIWIAFQPIVDDRTRGVFAYEALARSSHAEFPTPTALFDAAERLGRVHDLGRRLRALIADAMRQAPEDALVFVNVHPRDLEDPQLYAADDPLARSAKRIVLEITERSSLAAVSDVRTRVERLRDQGFRIALDDFGAGYAGFGSFNQLEPDIVKLDMSLIRELDRSPRKRAIVRSMISVCMQDLGTLVVCEGVETEAERAALRELGGELFQGFLCGRPVSGFLGVEQVDLREPPESGTYPIECLGLDDALTGSG